MPLTSLLDPVVQYLDGVLSPAPKLLGDGWPVRPNELPAVALSLADVSEHLRGIGRLPAPTLTGALRVDTTLDLANPVVAFPDEIVRLLSENRRTVQLAHGPVVRADGTTTPPWTTDDLRVVRSGTVLTPVVDPPGTGEVQILPDTAELQFPSALAATGTLQLGYFVGEWEVRTARYGGQLGVDVFADDVAGVDALSRQLGAALDEPPIPGLRQLGPTSWGPVVGNDALPANARMRTITYRFDFELIEPKLATGGGLITTVAVTSSPGPEHFDVTREGS
jgi:hypothetical protein